MRVIGAGGDSLDGSADLLRGFVLCADRVGRPNLELICAQNLQLLLFYYYFVHLFYFLLGHLVVRVRHEGPTYQSVGAQ